SAAALEPAPQSRPAGDTQPAQPAQSQPAPQPAPAASGPTSAPAPAVQPQAPESNSAHPPGASAPTAAPLPPPQPYQPRYHDREQVRALLADWGRARPGIDAHALDLGTTRGQLAIPAIEFGRPGDLPLERRPCVLLIGALDGVSWSGAEAVLSICANLLGTPDSLPAGVCFTALPWGSPDGLLAYSQGSAKGLGTSGGNALPIDDDHDGAIDEDGPDDVDGDGVALWMLIEDPDGPLARGSDARFLVPARAGEAPRYRL